LTVKGNFSWGLINKQEDEESDDEQDSLPCAKAFSCCSKTKKDGDKTEDKKEKDEDVKEKTVKSKLTLKNIDLEIQ
jgi:hypothetical protein